MQAGDVLQRHQDVAVQLDVGDVLDQAVGGQHAVLVLAPEHRQLDRLALVFRGVVVHLPFTLAEPGNPDQVPDIVEPDQPQRSAGGGDGGQAAVAGAVDVEAVVAG